MGSVHPLTSTWMMAGVIEKENKLVQRHVEVYKCHFHNKKKKKDVRSSTFFILPTNDSICDMVQNHFTHQKSIKSLQIESLWLKYSFLGRQGVYLPP